MKEQVTVECASPPSTAKEVGPLPVVANSKLPIHLVPSGTDDVDVDGHHRTRGGSGTGGLDGVMTGPGEDGGHGHGGTDGDVDGDAPELGSFGTMAAVIGDFSPQFKFSFTEDIHLDLGGGLKVGGCVVEMWVWWPVSFNASKRTDRRGTGLSLS